MHGASIQASRTVKVSELILSDRLIALAEDADRAGYTTTAEQLVTLACTVFDEAANKPH
ncbi:MAG: hypothetical protein WA864_31240 [Acetobacteraceae bacterium]|jgi:hypothetical protein